MNSILANLICIIHIIVVLFVIAVPFTNNDALLTLHFITLPFIWLHWMLNDDTCALTVLEATCRGMTIEEAKSGKSFFHNLVSPVYKIEDDDVRSIAWSVSIILWLVTAFKIAKRPSMLTDLFSNAKRMLLGQPLELRDREKMVGLW